MNRRGHRAADSPWTENPPCLPALADPRVDASTRCDLDHHEPFAAGGATEIDNIYPVDRTTHRAKTIGGWNYAIDTETGEITWTTGFGQTAKSNPYDYRLGP